MSDYHRPDATKLKALNDIANKLRIHSIQMTNASNSGHPTSCCSMAEIMSVLFFQTMRYNVQDPRNAAADRFVLSKGHAAPILYAAWAEAGLFPTSDLLNLRKLNSDLEGHPTPRLNFIDVATGSLGQGLSVAAGMAYTGKYFDKADYRVYCLIGDGESAEGSIWEAVAFASHYKLDNLVCIFDVNRLGQSQATSLGHDMATYKKRMEAFGWNTLVVNGHDVEELSKAFHEASTVKTNPTCILAETTKGKGCIDEIENKDGWHGKALGAKAEECIKAIEGRISNKGAHGLVPPAPDMTVKPGNISNVKLSEAPSYKKGQSVATRVAYGNALVKLGKNNSSVIALDGDMKNSTFSINFFKAYPERFIECFIAEQNMVGVGIGAACRDRAVVFMSTFSCFLTRAFDQIRVAAISQSNVNIVGSHAGVSIGEDGPSQMALEDLAMFRSIPTCTVFYPSDAVSAERATELAANTKGICFIRVSRPSTDVIYDNNEQFEIGKAKILRQSDSDVVTIVASCVTLIEALKAADTLKGSGINVCVIDPFTIKPLDSNTIIACAKKSKNRIITVEDHYPEGGIGEAVMSAVSGEKEITVSKLAVKEVPRSGKPAELMEKYGISASSILKEVQRVMTQ